MLCLIRPTLPNILSPPPPIPLTTLSPPHPHNKPDRELRQVCTDEGSDSVPVEEANSSRAGCHLHSVCPRRAGSSLSHMRVPGLCLCMPSHTHILVQGSHKCTRTPTPVHAYSHTTCTRAHTHSFTLSTPPFHCLLGYPQPQMLLYTVYRVYHVRLLSALVFNS